MTTGVLAPLLTPEFFANSGVFLVNGQLWSYQAGTTTPQATYTDATLSTPLSNPIVLNSRGEPQTATGVSVGIWVSPNVSYKFVLQDSLGNTIWTRDNVVQQQLLTLFGGVDTGSTNAYALTFTSPLTSYQNGEVIYWVPSNNNSGASTINVNGLGLISIVNPNGSVLGANQIVANTMTQIVYYNGVFQLVSLGNFTGSTVGTFGTETPLASATTTDLGSALAHVILITGTTTITGFGSSASLSAPIYMVRFNSALTLTYNSSTLILPGNANIVTTAGDALIAQYLGAGAWKVLFYQYASGGSNTKIKPADTPTTTSTALTADPDLQSNTLALGRYAFEIYLVFDSVTAGDGFKWTNGGTAVDSRGVAPAVGMGSVNGSAYGPKLETPYGGTISYATVATSSNGNAVLYKGSLLVGTVGTFGVSWAKVANGASQATTLRAGSYLTTSLLNTGAAATGTTHTYSSPGTFTETIPGGYNTLTIEVWGAAGGGGLKFGSGGTLSGGGGGASGAYSRTVLTVTGLSGDTATVVVGTGGGATVAGGASSVTGGTLPMTTMTSNGGNQGSNATASNAPGAGGTPTTATGGTAANISGNAGQAGQNASNGGFGGSGGGGISGVYGGGTTGGTGGGPSPATSGGNGLVIFTYAT